MKKKMITACIGGFLLALGLAFASCGDNQESSGPSLEYARVDDGYAVVGMGSYVDGVLDIPSTYKGKPVTTIAEGAFSYEQEIGIVNIPDSVTTIEKNAFNSCPNITSVSIGKNVTVIGDGAFTYCNSIAEITNLDSVETVGVEAFKGCVRLKSVEFSDSITTISDSAFEVCKALETVTFGQKIEWIGKRAFYECVKLGGIEIPDGAPTDILEKAFYGCENVNYIRLGDGVRSIGAEAFSACSLTREIVLGDGLVTIGSNAFASCRKVYQITLGSSLISIGDNAFSKCWLLREVCNRSNLTITKGTSSNGGVGYYAFYVRTGDEPTRLSKDENGLVYYTEGEKKILIAVDFKKSGPLVVPDDVTEIAPYAGYAVQEITSIYIGDGCKKIGEGAFRNTYQIREVTLGKNVEIVDDGAFRYNGYITTLVIGKNLKSVGKEAFLKKVGSKDYRAYKTVYYEGTQKEWNTIVWEEGNDHLLDISVTVAFYSETKPTLAGFYWHYVDGKATMWE